MNKYMKRLARPVIHGTVSVMDIGGTLSNFSRTEVDDSEAIKSDWKTVGEDLKKAVSSYAKKTTTNHK